MTRDRSSRGRGRNGLRIGAAVLLLFSIFSLAMGFVTLSRSHDSGGDVTTADPATSTTTSPAPQTTTATATPEPPVVPPPPPTLILLDASASMAMPAGDATRMDAATDALAAGLAELPDGARVGVWAYRQGPAPVERILDPIELAPRDTDPAARDRLDAALRGIPARDGTWTYPSVIEAMEAAQGLGITRILLVTDGPREYGRLSADEFLARVAEIHGGGGVRVDVLTLLAIEDVDVLRRLAETTGGRLVTFDSAADPGFARAAADFLR